MGRLLGRIHVAISGLDWNGGWTLDDVDAHTRAGLLPSQPTWVKDFVLDTLVRVEAWTPPRCQLLRGDGPGLLVVDDQISGMIDWGATKWGSVADDIGCWTVHLGLLYGGYHAVTADFVAAYRSTAPLTADEERAIALFQQLRLATRPPYTTDLAALDRMKTWIDGWQAERR